MKITESVMQWTRRLMGLATARARWSEACDVSRTLTISPTRARQLLDQGMTADEVVAHVHMCNALGLEP